MTTSTEASLRPEARPAEAFEVAEKEKARLKNLVADLSGQLDPEGSIDTVEVIGKNVNLALRKRIK